MNRSHHMPALTGLRGFAACWVVLLHLSDVLPALLPEVWPLIAPLARSGFLGVDVFFVLSGFVIAHNYAGRLLSRWAGTGRAQLRWPEYRAYLVARLARIYPVHVLLLVGLALAVRVAGFGQEVSAERFSGPRLLESLLLIQTWFGHGDAWNAVAWSISVEWFAYLVFPALMWLVFLLTPMRGNWPVAVVCVLSGLPGVHATLWRDVAGHSPFLLPVAVVEFLIGCMLARFHAQARYRFKRVARPELMLVALVLSGATLVSVGKPAAWSTLWIAPLILGLAHDDGPLSRLLSSRALQYLGLVSYSLYMTHYLWLWAMHSGWRLDTAAGLPVLQRIALLSLYVLPMFLSASTLYHLVEKPARTYFVTTFCRTTASAS